MLLLALVVLTGVQQSIVISADPSLLPELKAQLQAKGRNVIDATEIDHALFGPSPDEWSSLKHGLFDEPLPVLPADVTADVKRGVAGCQKTGEVACGQRLVQAVWQRYIERVRPEWVIELRQPMPGRKVGMIAEAAVYQPLDSMVSVVHPRGDDAKALVKMLLDAVFAPKRLAPNGTRPNSNILPGERTLPKPDLAQGTPQSLPGLKLKLPEGCKVPALEVRPQSAPLAVTVQALWTSTLEASKVTPEGTRSCVLELGQPYLTMSCGSSVQQVEVFAGTAFDDAKYQAGVAKQLVLSLAATVCR